MYVRTLALIALGLLVTTGAPAATHQVQQVGNTFVPDDLTIAVGDTVEWIYATGVHTVTEGTDDANPPIGSKLFDEPLTLGNPLVSFTFTSAGDVPYYCRPHLIFGMVGIIRVEPPTAAPSDVELLSFSRVKDLYR